MTALRRPRVALACAAAAALAGACGDDGYDSPTAPTPTRARVDIVYLAQTTTRPEVAAQHPACVQGVGMTHIHPGWRDFAAIPLDNGGDRWRISFADVPVGAEQSFRINDPNGCVLNPTGAVTTNISANGVGLTRVVPTPGSGSEPGLAFSVAANGTVTP
jgi:hypothetical protein